MMLLMMIIILLTMFLLNSSLILLLRMMPLLLIWLMIILRRIFVFDVPDILADVKEPTIPSKNTRNLSRNIIGNNIISQIMSRGIIISNRIKQLLSRNIVSRIIIIITSIISPITFTSRTLDRRW